MIGLDLYFPQFNCNSTNLRAGKRQKTENFQPGKITEVHKIQEWVLRSIRLLEKSLIPYVQHRSEDLCIFEYSSKTLKFKSCALISFLPFENCDLSSVHHLLWSICSAYELLGSGKLSNFPFSSWENIKWCFRMKEPLLISPHYSQIHFW